MIGGDVERPKSMSKLKEKRLSDAHFESLHSEFFQCEIAFWEFTQFILLF
jgi:hypothetical protein